jgi:hypothetical protein
MRDPHPLVDVVAAGGTTAGVTTFSTESKTDNRLMSCHLKFPDIQCVQMFAWERNTATNAGTFAVKLTVGQRPSFTRLFGILSQAQA